MKKILCLIAVVLIVAGGVLMAATFPTMYAERQRDKNNYTTVSEPIAGHYDSIEIHAENADIAVTNAGDAKPSVEAKTDPVYKITVTQEKGKLLIEETDLRKWYQKIGIFSPKPGKIEVKLADGIYPELNVKGVNGDIDIQADLQTVSFETIMAETTNGDTKVHIPVDYVFVKSVNGDISFVIVSGTDPVTGFGQSNVVLGKTTNGHIIDSSIAAIKSFTTGNGSIHTGGANTHMAKLYVRTANGDIELDRIYGLDIDVESVNGDVTASLWRPMACTATTKNGRITIPEESGEYLLNISTVNGDITVELAD